MRGLMLAARLRGAESFEDALDWMAREGYVVLAENGDVTATEKGVRRAEDILHPKLNHEDGRILYVWVRALREEEKKDGEIPAFDQTEKIVEWLVEHDLIEPVTRERCAEIVAAGIFRYMRGPGVAAQMFGR